MFFQYLLQIISRNIDVRWIYTVSEQLIEKKCVNDESYVYLLLKYLNTECTFCKIKKISDKMALMTISINSHSQIAIHVYVTEWIVKCK